MPARYRSSVPVRLEVSWARLPVSDRVLLLQLSRLPIGAHSIPFRNFNQRDLAALAAGMRVLIGLAEECRFALGYARAPKPPRKEKPSESEEKAN
jgi:hypothetical protein